MASLVPDWTCVSGSVACRAADTSTVCACDGRTFSGKVRKLKQHRRASASRLCPPGNPSIPPESTPEAPPSNAVIMGPTAATSQHPQQQQHADEMQPEASSVQQARHAQQAQQGSNFEQQATQQLPLLVQQPGFGAERMKLEQQLQQQLLKDRCAQAQHLGQLHEKLHQQPPAMKAGRRQRPTADAAGLACVGMSVQEEQGRMTQSGPFQPSAMAPAPVPELFQVCL